MRQLSIRIVVIAAVVVLSQLAPVPMAWSAPAVQVATLDDVADGAGETLDFPASHLAVQWQGDPEATVELRWRGDGGWSPWQAVEHAPDTSTDEVVSSGLVVVERATHVQARVGTAAAARHVKVVAIDTRYGPRRLVRASSLGGGSAAEASMDDTRVRQPGVVSRAEWGADESLRKGAPSHAPIKRLIVHHTVTSNNDPDPAATVRAIYAYHVQTGWDDIGYNFLVDARGRIYEGRYARSYKAGEEPTGEDTKGRGVIGAHTGGWNTGSVGVALLGTFTEQGPTTAAVNALQSFLAWKADRHDVNVQGSTDGIANLAGHRDFKATACPGDRLYAQLPRIRKRVADIVAAAHGLTKGYWVAAGDGQVLPFGEAASYGSMAGARLNAPMIGMAATVDDGGYWLLGADGGIFSFGNARFHGSTGAIRLNKPVVGMAPTPTGNGYWLVASDGGIFAFGDAGFFGSTGAIRLNKPVVGMAPTPSGQGYWLVASDGGIFAFGDAGFRGSTGNIRLNSPIVGMHAASDGRGYWMVAADGGVFAFNVPFHGSIPGLKLASFAGSAALRATGTDRGYYILSTDGGVYSFGDAKFHGARNVSPARARDMALIESPTETS